MTTSKITRRRLAMLLLVVPGLILLAGSTAEVNAQDTLVYVDVIDSTAAPGGYGFVDVAIQNVSDSIEAFELWFSLSRADIALFESDTTEDTCYTCIDSACTDIDTSLCTLVVVAVVDTGTLIEDWDYLEARTIGSGGTDLKVTAVANTSSSGNLPILPSQQGLLLRLRLTMNDAIPDTLQDRKVTINLISTISHFSDREGDLIEPTKMTGGSLTATGGIQVPNGDVNCDGVINVLDVVYMIDYVFRFGPPPCIL